MMTSKTLPLLLLGVLLLPGPLVFPASSPRPPEPVGALVSSGSIGDALRVMRRWMRRDEPVSDRDKIDRAAEALAELSLAWTSHPGRREEIQVVLLDFLGRSIRIADEMATSDTATWGAPLRRESGEAELRRKARSILRLRLPEMRQWLTREVLLLERSHPPERRVAACEVMAEDDSREVVLALFACTRSNPRAVREAAIMALAGREDPEVHRRMIELLDRADRGEADVPRGPIELHFATTSVPATEVATVTRIARYVSAALASEEWRQASRGVSVARCLPHDAAFPLLIAGMETWMERADGERPVRRVLGEIEAELRRRSGRSLGLHPKRWTALWEGHRRGDIALDRPERVGGTVTRAEFFGLRPVTDRVVFVLDRSGSMATSFGRGSNHSRLQEAAERLKAFLGQLGPNTHFTVVTFSDRANSWHERLRPASQSNVRSAATWVLHQGAEGGTQLRAGVLEAMQVDRKGRIDLDSLEADTVIVLCDGATAEGPGWVEPLLRQVNGEARLVFHAVQLGSGGDGTLQALCELTGGGFVQVDG